MDFTSMVSEARSCRRFDATKLVSKEDLAWLVDCARVTPSAANKQILRYITVSSKSSSEVLFGGLAWAAALKDWKGPALNERPTGYIVILVEKDKKDSRACIDMGIAAQTIQLAAHSKGLAACMFLSFNPSIVQEATGMPDAYSDAYEVALVIAIGVPVEKRVIVAVPESGEVTYYRDADMVHYIPKRSLEDILLSHI